MVPHKAIVNSREPGEEWPIRLSVPHHLVDFVITGHVVPGFWFRVRNPKWDHPVRSSHRRIEKRPLGQHHHRH